MTEQPSIQPSQPHEPSHRKRGLPPAIIVALTLGAVLVLGAAGLLIYTVTRPQAITVTGSLTITPYMSSECVGAEGYDDIRLGTSVVIHDSAGKVVATGQLDNGKYSEPTASCRFPFTVRNVPQQKFYGFEVSHRGTVTFTAKQVKDGPVALSLGS